MHSGEDEEPHDGDVHRQRPRRGQVGLREPPYRQAAARERPPLVEQVVVDDGEFDRERRRDHQRQAGEPVQGVQRGGVDHHPAGPDQAEADEPVVGDGVRHEATHPSPTADRPPPHPPRVVPPAGPGPAPGQPPVLGGGTAAAYPAGWRLLAISDDHGGSLPLRWTTISPIVGRPVRPAPPAKAPRPHRPSPPPRWGVPVATRWGSPAGPPRRPRSPGRGRAPRPPRRVRRG